MEASGKQIGLLGHVAEPGAQRLLRKLADIHAGLYGYEKTVTDEDLADFIKIEYSRIGANAHITPREIIRDFIELLNIVHQNPAVSVKELLGSGTFGFASSDGSQDDDIGEFDI